MNENSVIGPIRFDYKGKSILSYFTFSRSNAMSLKCYFGAAFFFIPFYTGVKTFGRVIDFEQFANNKRSQETLIGMARDFMDKTNSFYYLGKKGIYLSGEEHMNMDYVYLLGQKKEVSKFISHCAGGKVFYARSLKSLEDQFSELALSSFKKRIVKYKKEMGIEKELSVGLSEAINYLGVNYIKKDRILLNPILYSFKERVGDSVIIHELAHCFIPNHSKDFYNLVIKYCPRYYEYERIIENGNFTQG